VLHWYTCVISTIYIVIVSPLFLFRTEASTISSEGEDWGKAETACLLPLKITEMWFFKLSNFYWFIMSASTWTARRMHHHIRISIFIEGHHGTFKHLKIIFLLLLFLQRIIFSFFIDLFDTVNSSIPKYVLLFSQELLIFQILRLMSHFEIIFVFDLSLWLESDNSIFGIHHSFSEWIHSWIG